MLRRWSAENIVIFDNESSNELIEVGEIMFELSESQKKKLEDWFVKHKKKCKIFTGTTGGKYNYCFRPVGIGNIVVVKCDCGKEIDLTEEDKW